MFKMQKSRNNSNSLPQTPVKRTKKCPEKIFLFTNARDEPSILEWIFHHLHLGFTHTFIYDHMSIVPIQTLLDDYWVTNPDAKTRLSSRIHVIRIDDDNSKKVFLNSVTNIKIPLMNIALDCCIKERVDWLLYLDADEFLTINTGVFKDENPLKQLLTSFYFADTLAVNWLMFGSSNYETQPPGLIMNNFICSDNKLNPHVKTFVRPTAVRDATNPHYYPAIHTNRSFAVTGNSMDPTSPFNVVDMEFKNAPAYIAHYIVQSKNEFFRRKGRSMDDGTGDKSGMYPKEQLHVVHNHCPNKQLRERHGKELEQMFWGKNKD